MTLRSMHRYGLATTFALLMGGATHAFARDEHDPFYSVHALVSDRADRADHVDGSLRNPSGIVLDPDGVASIANSRTNTATFYDRTGTELPYPELSLPSGKQGAASPTGFVINPGKEFFVGRADERAAARFIFAGGNGTLMGWAPEVEQYEAVVAHWDDSGAVYKGLALARIDGHDFLYATDFHNARVDVFDGTFARVAPDARFEDPYIPAGYAPFGIQNVRGRLYVTFARQDGTAMESVAGEGFGFVDVFDTRGTLIHRIDPRAPLNAPWGVSLAPADFGEFGGRLLVANSGDGTIDAFDADSGAFLGQLLSSDGRVLRIEGLRGLSGGSGLFFTAAPGDGRHGELGRIDPAGAAQPASAAE